MPTIIPNWHPIFVHFTVALFSLAAGLFVISLFVKSPLKEQWQLVARWNLWFGAGLTVITALTGLYAYNTVAHDTPSHAAMTEHRNWAIVTITLMLALAVWSIMRVRRAKSLGALFIGAMAVTGGVLASTAWHGGEVVYRYGLGVISLPKIDTHMHMLVPSEEGGHVHSEDMTSPVESDAKMDYPRLDDMEVQDDAAAKSEIHDDDHDRSHMH